MPALSKFIVLALPLAAAASSCDEPVEGGSPSDDAAADIGVADTMVDDVSADATADVDGGDVGRDSEPDIADDTGSEVDAAPPCEPAPSCVDDAACAAPDVCSNGQCVAPRAPQEYEVAGVVSRVSAYGFGPASAIVRADVDGDGDEENVLGQLLGTLPGVADGMRAETERLIAGGRLEFMTEVTVDDAYCGRLAGVPTEGTAAATVTLHRGTRDLDADGLPDGEVARLLPAGFRGQLGPACVLTDGAAYPDGRVRAQTDGACSLPFPLGDARVRVPVHGFAVTLEAPDDAGTRTGVLSGYVRASDAVAEANRLIEECACAGIDPSEPVLAVTQVGASLRVDCAQSIVTPDGCDEARDGAICANLTDLCATAGLLSNAADISSGKYGPLKDSLSVALAIETQEVSLAEPPVVAPLQAFGDVVETHATHAWDWAQREGYLDVLANDAYDPVRHRLQSVEVVEPSAGVTARIDGRRIAVSVAPELPERGALDVRVRYTLGDDEAVSTADATVRVHAVTSLPTLVHDAIVATLPGPPVTFDLMANDVIEEGAWGVVASVGEVALGTFALTGDTTVAFTPTAAGTEDTWYSAHAYSEMGGSSGYPGGDITVTVVCADGHSGPTCAPE